MFYVQNTATVIELYQNPGQGFNSSGFRNTTLVELPDIYIILDGFKKYPLSVKHCHNVTWQFSV